MTRVSKKFFSLRRSIISDIHGKGFCAPGIARQAQLRQATVADELQVFFHHSAFMPNTPRGMVSRAYSISSCVPSRIIWMTSCWNSLSTAGVFELDLVDDVDAEIKVHGFIAQNVLELLRYAGHFVAASHG